MAFSLEMFPKKMTFCFSISRSTGYSEVIVVVGGCERVGGFNLPYTECYDPMTGEWKSLAKLPEFTKSEYAVCALRNDILVSGKYFIVYIRTISGDYCCASLKGPILNLIALEVCVYLPALVVADML